MTSNINEFNKQLASFATSFVPMQFRAFQIKVALELFTRIILKNPVDTGRSRGNWQIGIGASPTTILDERSSDEAINDGLSKLGAYTSGVVTIFITNNVNYISFLEEGSSTQAPRGMVAVSIEEVETIFAQVRDAA